MILRFSRRGDTERFLKPTKEDWCLTLHPKSKAIYCLKNKNLVKCQEKFYITGHIILWLKFWDKKVSVWSEERERENTDHEMDEKKLWWKLVQESLAFRLFIQRINLCLSFNWICAVASSFHEFLSHETLFHSLSVSACTFGFLPVLLLQDLLRCQQLLFFFSIRIRLLLETVFIFRLFSLPIVISYSTHFHFVFFYRFSYLLIFYPRLKRLWKENS